MKRAAVALAGCCLVHLGFVAMVIGVSRGWVGVAAGGAAMVLLAVDRRRRGAHDC